MMAYRTRTLATAGLMAVTALTSAPASAQRPSAAATAAANMETPRTRDGKVDLSGLWNGRADGSGFVPKVDAQGNVFLQPPSRGADLANFEKDSAIEERSSPNKPIYRPEYWDKIQDLDWNGLTLDPVFICRPAGVPRMGPPQKIVQTPTEVILLYETQNVFRIIPIDGRARDEALDQDQTWMGAPVGHWEGDTLVIESAGFNDESWIGWPGYIHSNEMKVVEKFSRRGNTLSYQATVIDPKMMQQPWVLEPVARFLNGQKNAALLQDLPCEERDAEHIVLKNMRG